MNTRKEQDEKNKEIIFTATWKKLSIWNKFLVWLYAVLLLCFGKIIQKHKTNSIVIKLVRGMNSFFEK